MRFNSQNNDESSWSWMNTIANIEKKVLTSAFLHFNQIYNQKSFFSLTLFSPLL